MNYYEIIGIYDTKASPKVIEMHANQLGKILNRHFKNDEELTDRHLRLDLTKYYIDSFYSAIDNNIDLIAKENLSEEEKKAYAKSLAISHTISALKQITGEDTTIIPKEYPYMDEIDVLSMQLEYNSDFRKNVYNNYSKASGKLKNPESRKEFDEELALAKLEIEDRINEDKLFDMVNSQAKKLHGKEFKEYLHKRTYTIL